MVEGIRWVGLDVHASRTAVAVVDSETGEVTRRTVLGRPHEVMELLESVPGPVRAVYEAGPTGYGLARCSRPGLQIEVCAPGEIPAGGGASSRIKTDARDAMKLARLLAAGQLTMVVVPSVEQEQVRDLVRAREDVRADLMRGRHRPAGRVDHQVRIGSRPPAARRSRLALPQAAPGRRRATTPPGRRGPRRGRLRLARPTPALPTWQDLNQVRGKRATVTNIAVARELSHFCWEITRP